MHHSLFRVLGVTLLSCLILCSCSSRESIRNQGSNILLKNRFSEAEVFRIVSHAGDQLGWSIVPVGPGQYEGTKVKDDMKAVAIIKFTDNSILINYRDSENMGYQAGEICETYNEWVRALNNRILREFANLQ